MSPNSAYLPGLWTSDPGLVPGGLHSHCLKVQLWLPVSRWYVGASAPFPATGSGHRLLSEPTISYKLFLSFPFLLSTPLPGFWLQLCAPRAPLASPERFISEKSLLA